MTGRGERRFRTVARWPPTARDPVAGSHVLCGRIARMVEEPSRTKSWFGRPRRPLPGFFDNLLFGLFAIFWLGVVFLVGLGVVVGEPGAAAKAGGSLAIVLSTSTLVWLVAYARRPVGEHDPEAKSAMERAAADSWAAALDRDGHVELALSKRKAARAFGQVVFALLLGALLVVVVADAVAIALGVVVLALVVFLGLLPHLEVATAGRPALRVDSRGVEIARWFPLEIPWTKVLGVRAAASTARNAYLVVAVDDEFYVEYLASRPFPLRITDAVFRKFDGSGFVIPATIGADPETLAVWLDREVGRRNPGVDRTQRHRLADTDEPN